MISCPANHYRSYSGWLGYYYCQACQQTKKSPAGTGGSWNCSDVENSTGVFGISCPANHYSFTDGGYGKKCKSCGVGHGKTKGWYWRSRAGSSSESSCSYQIPFKNIELGTCEQQDGWNSIASPSACSAAAIEFGWSNNSVYSAPVIHHLTTPSGCFSGSSGPKFNTYSGNVTQTRLSQTEPGCSFRKILSGFANQKYQVE